jgi:hypothetical protein
MSLLRHNSIVSRGAFVYVFICNFLVSVMFHKHWFKAQQVKYFICVYNFSVKCTSIELWKYSGATHKIKLVLFWEKKNSPDVVTWVLVLILNALALFFFWIYLLGLFTPLLYAGGFCRCFMVLGQFLFKSKALRFWLEVL